MTTTTKFKAGETVRLLEGSIWQPRLRNVLVVTDETEHGSVLIRDLDGTTDWNTDRFVVGKEWTVTSIRLERSAA